MSLTIRAAVFLHLAAESAPREDDARLKALIRALRDPSWEVRYDAATELGTLGPRAATAVPELIEALDDDHLAVRTALVDTLAAIGPSAAPALVASFADSRWKVRFGASRALKKMGF